MTEQHISFIERTFYDLKKGVIPEVEDPYHIMSSLSPQMRDALLNNPSGFKDEDICQILAVYNNQVIVGVLNLFLSRLCLNGKVEQCQTGNYLYSHPDYKNYNIGGVLFHKYVRLKPDFKYIAGGLSQTAIPLHKALRYSVFEFPRFIYLLKSRSVIQAFLHSESSWTNILIKIIDAALWIHRSFSFTLNRKKKYVIEQVYEVPEVVEEIIMSDRHPFMEFHDKKWFEWCLNYSFSRDEKTKRKLFVVKRHGTIEGFFMIKQEFFEQASSRGYKNIYLGSIMEWGIASNSKMTEKDLVLMSLGCFDNNIDGVQYATNNRKVIKSLKKHLFVNIGNANLAVRPNDLKDIRFRDMNNWRLRLAFGDTMLN